MALLSVTHDYTGLDDITGIDSLVPNQVYDVTRTTSVLLVEIRLYNASNIK